MCGQSISTSNVWNLNWTEVMLKTSDNNWRNSIVLGLITQNWFHIVTKMDKQLFLPSATKRLSEIRLDIKTEHKISYSKWPSLHHQHQHWKRHAFFGLFSNQMLFFFFPVFVFLRTSFFLLLIHPCLPCSSWLAEQEIFKWTKIITG